MDEQSKQILQAALVAAWNNFESGDYEGAEDRYQKVLDVVGEKPGEIRFRTLHGLGYVYMHQGRVDDAFRVYDEVLTYVRARGRVRDEAVTLHQMGVVFRTFRNHERATEYFEMEQDVIRREMDSDPFLLSANLWELGMLAWSDGVLDVAEERLQESLDNAIQVRSQWAEACALRGLGDVQASKGNPAAAHDFWQRAIDLFDGLGEKKSADEVRKVLEAGDRSAPRRGMVDR